VTATNWIRRGATSGLVVSLAAAWLVLGSSLAQAEETDEEVFVGELPGIACEDLYQPPGGQIIAEETGAGFSQCVFATPQGVSVFGWSVDGYSSSSEPWGLWADAETLADASGIEVSQETFGTFYEVVTDAREWRFDLGGHVDTTPERWGVYRDGRLWVLGSPQAIDAILAGTEQRRQLIQENIDREEDPANYQSQWDLSAPDCSDLWDGAGLDPGYEVFTNSRNQDFVQCWVIAKGENPYAYGSYPVLEFGYTVLQCPADLPYLRGGFYDFESDESFGLYRFYLRDLGARVAGERTEYSGSFADENNCVLYSGWPEVIARMVDFRSGLEVTEEDDNASAGRDAPTFTPPSLVTTASALGALTALIMASLLLAVRKPLTARHASRPSPTFPAPPIARSQSSTRTRRFWLVVCVTAMLALGTLFISPALVMAIIGGSLPSAALGNHFFIWATPVLALGILGVAIAAGAPRAAPSVHWPLAIVSLVVLATGLALLLTQQVAGATLATLALLLAFAGWETGLREHRRHTMLLLLLTLVGLALLTGVGANSMFGLFSGGIEQIALIALGMMVTSSALLVLPVRSFPGAGMWQSHPVMWAVAMVLSWWMVTLVWGMVALVTAIYSAVALGAVVLSHLFHSASSPAR